jgi:glycerol-3-phosphate dehydrogenase
MNRTEMLGRLATRREHWDLLVIGGGATGAGIAVDAAARGHAVLLVEQDDFGKGTSSRSTKLVHGGVRYLQQGNISLVMEALKERGLLRRNAPHLVRDLRFIVPNYDWWEAPFYGIGLKVYDLLAGRYGFGPSRILSREETLRSIPTLRTEGLRGGVQYFDGQFDDARLLINLIQTAAEQGATVLNYMPAVRLTKDATGLVTGAVLVDRESGEEFVAEAWVTINATGPFADDVRRMDEPGAPAMIAPSQGVHLVLPSSFLSGESAIMVPHTPDGRVLFAIPWHDRTVVGTTDTPIAEPVLEPRPLPEEIEFILETAGHYLDRAPTRADVRSAFAGIRPLVKAGEGTSTAALSRDHTIHISNSGLITIAGGKWTTYRHMAEDCVNQAVTLGQLPERPCPTRELRIHGHHEQAEDLGPWAIYGSDAPALEELLRSRPGLERRLHPDLPLEAVQVVWAARREMARTVEDVLARRTRCLLLDARASLAVAPDVAALLAAELERDESWQRRQVEEFRACARGYLLD